ncbi:hypothetical protein VTI74DRAFT_9713 [Chaetomium olivicolor]
MPDDAEADCPSKGAVALLDNNTVEEQSDADSRPGKRRKTTPNPNPRSTAKTNSSRTVQALSTHLPHSQPHLQTCPLPSRTHPLAYHTPLLLTLPSVRHSLLAWFSKTMHIRPMPWRKPFTPPSTLSRSALSKRAYEVWISEIMLQQTRVATVVGYWSRWMQRWPTMGDLARAEMDEVLRMWAGLGYYSRARRVWEGARRVCADEELRGLLPGSVGELMEKVPGVGRYTAGAIAAIVFGVAAPMVDGNVLRVLSRQMGVLGDVERDKRVVEVLWEAAEKLVQAVAADGDDREVNDRPGQWGQALMELGSTVCTPKPNCSVCPITETCRAYAEGVALAEGNREDVATLADIEDVCGLCVPLWEVGEQEDEEKETKATDEKGLSPFFSTTKRAKPRPSRTTTSSDARTLRITISHAQKFPFKKPKKQMRQEHTLVCAIRRTSDGHYLIHRRPEKGLLAGLWELPSCTLLGLRDNTNERRKSKATEYVVGLVKPGDRRKQMSSTTAPKHVADLGSVPWQFSHLKLIMHVHLFEVDDVQTLSSSEDWQRWASAENIDKESIGTGMKKCWMLVRTRTEEMG